MAPLISSLFRKKHVIPFARSSLFVEFIFCILQVLILIKAPLLQAEAEEEVPAEPDRAGAVRGQPGRRPLTHRAAAHGGQAVRTPRLHGYRRRQLPSYLR